MQNKRLAQLQEFLLTTPDDPFLKYAIATEFVSAEEFAQALLWFKRTHSEHPDYLPTYYQYGKLLYETGNEELSKNILEEGIELAKVADNRKTWSELKEMYEDLFDF